MLRALVLLVAGALALACLLTPPLYSAIAGLYSEPPWPYSRVFNRVAMLCALTLLGVALAEAALTG